LRERSRQFAGIHADFALTFARHLGLRETVYFLLEGLRIGGSRSGRERGRNRRGALQNKDERKNRDCQGCETDDPLQLHEDTSAVASFYLSLPSMVRAARDWFEMT
jgi:hypothetical protein